MLNRLFRVLYFIECVWIIGWTVFVIVVTDFTKQDGLENALIGWVIIVGAPVALLSTILMTANYILFGFFFRPPDQGR